MVKPWVETAITLLLRVGVVLSAVIIVIGMAVTMVHHPEYFSSRQVLGYPNTLLEVASGVLHGQGPAIMMAGLLVLIATPVARVALSVVIFIFERDRLYIAITATVFVILMFSFAVGLPA